jgi:hypothetical protein
MCLFLLSLSWSSGFSCWDRRPCLRDSQRTIRELSAAPLGRLMCTREVHSDFLFHSALNLDLFTSTRDGKHESCFGATPIPGKWV